MDPRKNPYTPGAGCAEQSMIVTGFRGVGKTVVPDVFRYSLS